jgi:Protein of unknown function (DUF2975)
MNTNPMTPKARTRFNRIKVVSQIFKALSFLCFLFFSLGTLGELLLWAWHGSVMDDSANPLFVPQHHTLENLWLVGSTATFGWLAWYGYRLFRRYESGQLFSPANISLLRKIAWVTWLLAAETALSYALWNPKHPQEDLSVGGAFATIAFPGILIFFFAWIMDEGRKLQEEQELTV